MHIRIYVYAVCIFMYAYVCHIHMATIFDTIFFKRTPRYRFWMDEWCNKMSNYLKSKLLKKNFQNKYQTFFRWGNRKYKNDELSVYSKTTHAKQVPFLGVFLSFL